MSDATDPTPAQQGKSLPPLPPLPPPPPWEAPDLSAFGQSVHSRSAPAPSVFGRPTAGPPAYGPPTHTGPVPGRSVPAQPVPGQAPFQHSTYDRSAFEHPASGPTAPVRARPNEALGIALLVLSGVVLLASILRAATSLSAVRAYDLAVAEGRDPAQVVTAHDLVGVLWLVVVPTWIVGSLWLSRARQNAALFAPAHIRRSPAWAWLGWVVPIVSLFFPKQMVDDCWQITSGAIPGAGPRSRYKPTAVWWGLWFAFSFLSGLASRLNTTGGLSGTDPHQGVLPALEIATAIVGILAFAAWARVVLGVTRAQTELAGGPAPW